MIVIMLMILFHVQLVFLTNVNISTIVGAKSVCSVVTFVKLL